MGVSSGDSLRIQASEWNRVLQMIRDWKAPNGAQGPVSELPCLKAIIRAKFGERRPSIYEAVDIVHSGVEPETTVAATLPLGDEWQPSDLERTHILRSGDYNYGERRLQYQVLRPRRIDDDSVGDLHKPFAICLNPSTLEFAVSGFALVRVRLHSQWHTYARRPILIPGDSNVAGNANPDVTKYTGCLDSSGSGPAKIIAVLDKIANVAWEVRRAKACWALIRW